MIARTRTLFPQLSTIFQISIQHFRYGGNHKRSVPNCHPSTLRLRSHLAMVPNVLLATLEIMKCIACYPFFIHHHPILTAQSRTAHRLQCSPGDRVGGKPCSTSCIRS